MIALAGSLAAIGTMLAALSRQTDSRAVALPGASAPDAVSARLAAPAAQVAVVDGGTLRLGERVVRLIGVEPPPRGAACPAADGAATDCATAAANALAALVWALPVTCLTHGQDELGRFYATCEAGGTDLGLASVASGWNMSAAKRQPGNVAAKTPIMSK